MSVATIASPRLTDQPLRVLTPLLSAHIAAVNAVRAKLIAKGYKITAQDLRPGGGKPLLTLACGDLGLRTLAQRIRAGLGDDGAVLIASIDGVDVQWPAVQP